MTTGLEPVYGLDGSHPQTPGFMGAMTQPARDFGRDVNQHDAGEDDADMMAPAALLQRAQEAHAQAKTYYEANLISGWERTYKAFRNQHFQGSKYHSPEFRGRSKMFRPKTRSAVRKQMTQAAHALFANADVVAIAAQDDSNPEQRASAAIKQELLNYRLSRKSRRNGINWFLVTMGARQDATLSGICISKQSWRYSENKRGTVIEDRPDVGLFPPEDVLIDPNASWMDPAQSASYLILKHPMTAEDAMGMMKSSTNFKWLKVTKEDLNASGRAEASGAAATRQARTGGTDPKNDAHGVYQQIWLHEVYMRIDGEEYVFWMLGNQRMLSEPALVEDAYPFVHGARPIVIGYGALESHRTFPMSPAESWQPLQMEANDQANLRLDHMKMKVDPPTKVKRGQKVDLQQVQRKGPGSIILVQDHADIESHEVQDVPQSAYVESNYLNADFDDLAGSFNSGTVQTNRSLNETVGGMKLLSADANAVGEFDLAVFVETYVEVCLWQIMKLIEMYETDSTLLVIAGKKAGLLQKYGINEITDQMLRAETSLTVNVGVGSASSPQEKVNRFLQAAQGAGTILGPMIQAGAAVMPKAKTGEIIDTIFGGAGFPDAMGRFFHEVDDDAPPQPPQQEGPPPDPAAQAKAQAIQQKAQIDGALGQQKMKQAGEKHQLDMAAGQQKLQLTSAQMAAKLHADRQKHQLAAAGAQQQQEQAGQTHMQRLAAMRQQQMQANQPGMNSEGEGADVSPMEAEETAAPQQELVMMMQQLMQGMAMIGQQVEEIADASQSPAELIRDPRTGQTIAVRKGGKVHKIMRDEKGRASGLGPAIEHQGA